MTHKSFDPKHGPRLQEQIGLGMTGFGRRFAVPEGQAAYEERIELARKAERERELERRRRASLLSPSPEGREASQAAPEPAQGEGRPLEKRKRGRPRIKDARPWEKAGVSRSTWARAQRGKGERGE
jgi:hypothetical protein